MRRALKTLLDRYVLSRIDRALDDAAPLTGWMAWYVRNNPEVREYYEQMLEMELELRFPENATETANVFRVSVSSSLLYAASERPNRHVLRGIAVVLFIAIGITAYFSPFKAPFKSEPTLTSGTVAAVSGTPIEKPDDAPTIDLAEFFTITSPPGNFLPPFENPFESPEKSHYLHSPFDEPVASLVRFSKQPLESTLSFLESANIITRQSVDSEDL